MLLWRQRGGLPMGASNQQLWRGGPDGKTKNCAIAMPLKLKSLKFASRLFPVIEPENFIKFPRFLLFFRLFAGIYMHFLLEK